MNEPVLVSVDFEIINNVSEETDNKVRAAKKIDKDKDLMYVKFRYVHEGSNANNDVFEAEDLKDRHSTAIYKPINWEHKESDIIGTIYDTEFVDRENSNNGKAYVNIYGVIYKYLFPEKANEIRERYENNSLAISMETWFDKAVCSVCGGEFVDESDYCIHLKERYVKADNKRILKGITFGGAGIVKNPADKDAKGLSVASKTKSGELKDRVKKSEEIKKFETILYEATSTFYDILYTYYSKDEEGMKKRKERLKSLISDLKELIDTININKIAKGERNVENITYPKEAVEALLKIAKADKEEEFAEKLNSEMEKIKEEMKKESASLQEELDKVKADKEKVEKELQDLKDKVEKDKILAERKKVLADKNIEIPEDKDEVIVNMTEEAFNLFVEAKVAKAEEPEEPEKEKDEEEPEKTDASFKVNDADVPSGDDDNPLAGIKKL